MSENTSREHSDTDSTWYDVRRPDGSYFLGKMMLSLGLAVAVIAMVTTIDPGGMGIWILLALTIVLLGFDRLVIGTTRRRLIDKPRRRSKSD